MVHLPAWFRHGGRILDIIAEEGGDLSHTILCHMNPSGEDVDYQTSCAKRGAFIEYDMIGMDYWYADQQVQCPSDEDNARAIKRLIDLGFLDRILVLFLFRLDQGFAHAPNLARCAGRGPIATRLERPPPGSLRQAASEAHVPAISRAPAILSDPHLVAQDVPDHPGRHGRRRSEIGVAVELTQIDHADPEARGYPRHRLSLGENTRHPHELSAGIRSQSENHGQNLPPVMHVVCYALKGLKTLIHTGANAMPSLYEIVTAKIEMPLLVFVPDRDSTYGLLMGSMSWRQFPRIRPPR